MSAIEIIAVDFLIRFSKLGKGVCLFALLSSALTLEDDGQPGRAIICTFCELVHGLLTKKVTTQVQKIKVGAQVQYLTEKGEGRTIQVIVMQPHFMNIIILPMLLH